MEVPQTHWRSQSASKDYRYGYNGQEKDDEIYRLGNFNTATFWEYDTRLGRRWNIDPNWSPWRFDIFGKKLWRSKK